MKRTMLASGLAGVLLLGPAAAVATAAPAAPSAPVFTACAQVYAAGFADVRVGAVVGGRLVPSALDRDDDGIACEREDGAGSSGGSSSSGTSSTSSTSGSTANADDGSEGGQVSVVPAGSAPTGDGSTDIGTGDVTTVLGWVGWSGAAVLAMLAAAVGVRQAGRERARRGLGTSGRR